MFVLFPEESGDYYMTAHLEDTVSTSVYKNPTVLKYFINY